MNNPLISVIVTCYNREQYIRDCLLSLINQSYSNWECILVDDGSTDNSRAIINELIVNDNRFHFIPHEHVGFPLAKNIGLDNAHGEYIIFLDSDDIAHPDWLSLLMYMRQLTGAPVTVCSFDAFTKTSEVKNIIINKQRIFPISEYKFLAPLLVYNPRCMHFMWNKLVRADLYKNIRFVDQPALSDVAVMAEVFSNAHYVVHLRLPLVHYRQHDQSMGTITKTKGPEYWAWRINFQKEKLRKDWERSPQARFSIRYVLKQEIDYARKELKDDFDKYCSLDDVQDMLHEPIISFTEQ